MINLSKWIGLFSIIVLVGIVSGCTNKDAIKDIAEDDLLVDHWHDLDEDDKYSVVRNAMGEGNIFMRPDGYREFIKV